MGRYTAKIAAMRADKLRLIAIGIIPIKIDYSALFTNYEQVTDKRIEQEILDRFGGYDAMIATFEAEMVGEISMTATEAIAYLRSLGPGAQSD